LSLEPHGANHTFTASCTRPPYYKHTLGGGDWLTQHPERKRHKLRPTAIRVLGVILTSSSDPEGLATGINNIYSELKHSLVPLHHWVLSALGTKLLRTSVWQNHLRNEGFVTSRLTGRFSVKRECANTHNKDLDTISEVTVKLLQLRFRMKRIAEAVSLKEWEFVRKHFLDGYKGIHLALEVKSFVGSLYLRWVVVRGSTIGSLDLPLITTIGITGREREREITCTQEINKAKLERQHSVRLARQGSSNRRLAMQRLQMDSRLTCLQRLAPNT
jgi:hypothetical protein